MKEIEKIIENYERKAKRYRQKEQYLKEKIKVYTTFHAVYGKMREGEVYGNAENKRGA